VLNFSELAFYSNTFDCRFGNFNTSHQFQTTVFISLVNYRCRNFIRGYIAKRERDEREAYKKRVRARFSYAFLNENRVKSRVRRSTRDRGLKGLSHKLPSPFVAMNTQISVDIPRESSSRGKVKVPFSRLSRSKVSQFAAQAALFLPFYILQLISRAYYVFIMGTIASAGIPRGNRAQEGIVIAGEGEG
jgi:hypothetical protein